MIKEQCGLLSDESDYNRLNLYFCGIPAILYHDINSRMKRGLSSYLGVKFILSPRYFEIILQDFVINRSNKLYRKLCNQTLLNNYTTTCTLLLISVFIVFLLCFQL